MLRRDFNILKNGLEKGKMKNQKVFDPLIAVRYGEVKITDAVLLGKLKTIGEFYLSIPLSGYHSFGYSAGFRQGGAYLPH